jgi:DNA-binding phage protein
MALTKDFRETIRERAQQEPAFRKALLREAIELMLSGDEKTGRAILRNYINATVGFPQLEQATAIPATSLMRMFGPNGNPSAKNLFRVLAHLQSQEGVSFEIRPQRCLVRFRGVRPVPTA